MRLPQGKNITKDEFDAVGMQCDWEFPLNPTTLGVPLGSVAKSLSNAVVPQQLRQDPNSPVSPEEAGKVFPELIVMVAWLRTNVFFY